MPTPRRRWRRRAREQARSTPPPRARGRRRASRRSGASPPATATRRADAWLRSSREQRLPRVVVWLSLQLFEQLALTLLQPLRNGDADPGQQIATAGAPQLRGALALHAQ